MARLRPSPGGSEFEPISETADRDAGRAGGVLLAGGDALFRTYTRALLERSGFTVVVAANAEAAREAVRKGTCGLVVCDLTGALDGPELLALAPEAPIAFLFIGAGSDTEEARCLALGAKEYLRRPLADQVFLARLRRVAVQFDRRVEEDSWERAGPVLGPARAVGDFVVERPLGRGGMGMVYLATQRSLGRKVALKVLHRGFDPDGRVGARFFGEARLAAGIDHPNIVKIYDVGCEEDGGRPFIAMEFLAGETLAARMRRGPVPFRTTLAVGIAVAEGLGAAWKRGLVHRDVKPGNIVLCDDGPIKILDFGVAKRTDPEATQLTGTGVLIGTPEYMAPEQADGRLVDCRADLYSLGVILYELLAGARPFEADDVAGLLYLHNWVAPPLIRATRRSVPARFDELLARLLAKRKTDRYAAPAELAADLRRLQRQLGERGMLDRCPEGPPVTPLDCDASRVGPPRRLRPTRLSLALLGLALVAALAGLGHGLGWW